jgi:hypothetical protein
MPSISEHGGATNGVASADVTETDDPAVQAEIDARRASEAHDEVALLKRKLREAEDREADAADRRRREDAEREQHAQRAREDAERLTAERDELQRQLDERGKSDAPAPRKATSKGKSAPADDGTGA